MTNREAIELLKEEIPPWIKWNGDGDSQMVVKLTEAFNLSIQALEKQEPKKVLVPLTDLEKYYHEENCPNCKKEFRVKAVGYTYKYAVGKTKHCPYCGQAIDWRK